MLITHMSKFMKLRKQADLREDEYEYHVPCGVKTRYKRSVPIQTRIGYEIGVGQLCEHCNSKMERKELTAEHNKRLQQMNTREGG